MSMSVKELRQFRDNLERLKDRAPEVMEEILIGEGTFAVRQARNIVTDKKKVNTGAYRYNFHTGTKAQPAHTSARIHDGSKPRRQGRTWVIDVYNNLDYASFLEMGFRSTLSPDTGRGIPLSISETTRRAACMSAPGAAMYRAPGPSERRCAAPK